MKDLKQVVIIGGGIIGTMIAYFLSRDGRRVTLLERGALAQATTAKNTGVLALCSRPPDHRAAVAIYGKEIYKSLQLELNDGFSIDERGSMVLLPPGSPDHLKYLEDSFLKLKSMGAKPEMLDGEEVKRRAPALAMEVEAALLDTSASLVDAAEIAKALASQAASQDGEIREYEPVQSILTRGGRVVGVHTDKGDIEADAVVVAAGVWSPLLTKDLGLQLPVVPRRGQLLHTEKMGVLSPHLLQSASYVLHKTAGERTHEEPMARFLFSFTLDQHAPGHCVLGTTREFVGFDEQVTDEGRVAMLQSFEEWFPALGKPNIVREVAGLRPWTPDHHPIVGPSSIVEGLWYATGHEGSGINLAPITAKMTAELMAGREMEVPDWRLASMLPDRLGL